MTSPREKSLVLKLGAAWLVSNAAGYYLGDIVGVTLSNLGWMLYLAYRGIL